MKSFDQLRIRQAEIAQLIVLQGLFSLKESRDVFFQGGTAIRWFYGGLRFSEDLDFVSSWSSEKAAIMVDSAAEQIRRYLVANFGPGDFFLKQKKSRVGSYRAFLDFSPSGKRQKISVKVEFEQLAGKMKPKAEKIIMQAAPAVAYFLREAGFGSAGATVIINVERAEEILTDKLRALMERPYTKGRDFFDVWFLTKTLGVRPDPDGLSQKLSLYAVPFTEKTSAAFYAELDKLNSKDRKTLVGEIQQDLLRFVDARTLEVLAHEDYRELLDAVQKAFRLSLRPKGRKGP
jgi:predicted nucleotidyltransferase component of viral defense system